MTPPAVSKASRQEQIIQAAIACFARKGYHLTTMDDIVAESGLSKGSLYWHFKNKKDLLINAAVWYFDQLAANMKLMMTQIPQAIDQLKTLFGMLEETIVSDDPMLSVFIDFYAETRHDADVHSTLRQLMNPYFEIIGGIIQQGVDDGELRAMDAKKMAAALMATFDGLFVYKMMLGDTFDWRQTSRQLSEVLLMGMQQKAE